MKKLRLALVWLSIAWAVLLPVATLAASRSGPTSSAMEEALVFVVYRASSIVCHQRPERSFHLFSVQMPVCARCTGIYVGGALVAAAMAIGGRRADRVTSPFVRDHDPSIESSRARLVLFLSLLPGAATLVYEWTTGDVPGNAIRAITGLLLGGAIAWIVLRAAKPDRR